MAQHVQHIKVKCARWLNFALDRLHRSPIVQYATRPSHILFHSISCKLDRNTGRVYRFIHNYSGLSRILKFWVKQLKVGRLKRKHFSETATRAYIFKHRFISFADRSPCLSLFHFVFFFLIRCFERNRPCTLARLCPLQLQDIRLLIERWAHVLFGVIKSLKDHIISDLFLML